VQSWRIYRKEPAIRFLTGLISLFVTLLFGAALLLSFADPRRIEAFAQDLLEREVAARVGDSLSALERSAVGHRARGSTRIVNLFLSAIGSAATVSAC